MNGLKIMKQTSGVEIRGNTIRIHFSHEGIRCRETLKLEPTKSNIKYATMLRGEIQLKINQGKFSYADYFPNSNNVSKFGLCHKDKKYRCNELLTNLLEDYKKLTANNELSASTLDGYRKIINGLLLPYFGNYFISEVTPIVIKEWIEGIDATAKRIKNALTPLRAMFDDALNNQIITSNPLDKLAITKLLKINAIKSTYEVYPFTMSEKTLIISKSPEGNIRNLFQFGFYSGFRTSELIALTWNDVDLTGFVSVSKAKVCGIIKGTKTKSGTRKVKVYPEALEALKLQFAISGKDGKEVFLNPNTGKPWSHSNKIADAWRKVLASCDKMQYRNCYQMRHTFASNLLSAGENPLKIAKLMGHIDTTMVFKVYGKWIPEDDLV